MKLKKTIRIIAFFFFICFHLIFLTSILLDKLHHVWVIAGIVFISAIITYAYYHKSMDEEDHFLEDLQDIIYVVIGGVFTYFISNYLNLGSVIGAGLTGTLASFAPAFIKNKPMKRFPVACYCGAFVGMTAPNVAEGYSFIIFATFITGVFFSAAKNVFNGYGGKLGTIAFGGVAITSLLIYLFA
ncbi:hypothetical protein [Zunongwangia sp.]|uniref:hypothetical protein n=1 Tax=Zunongwangia sp. TaxID=1965325 RepID=UPI003AA96AC8